MEALLSLLLFVFFFIIIITRIIRFIIKVFRGIEERPDNTSSSEGSTDSSRGSKRKPETSRPAPGSRKGPPPGFELDLSEIDDKFGENKGEKKKKPEILESDTVKKYKARQEEKDKKNNHKSVRPQRKRGSIIESDEIGSSGEIAGDLSFDNDSLVKGIMMKEILSPPRSLKPYKPRYKDK
ncbi:MAG: hypothetical protein ACOCQF_00870 [Halanaerobiaceae bacterium]